jgi:hypothetical protein
VFHVDRRTHPRPSRLLSSVLEMVKKGEAAGHLDVEPGRGIAISPRFSCRRDLRDDISPMPLSYPAMPAVPCSGQDDV